MWNLSRRRLGYPTRTSRVRAPSTLTAFGLADKAQPGEALVWSTPTGRGARRVAVGVDVGRSAELGRLVAQAAPAILVLTHDDLDHIDGWRGFAPLGLATLQELWIPYEWAALLDSYDALSHGRARVDPGIDVHGMAERLRSDFAPARRFPAESTPWSRAPEDDGAAEDIDEGEVARAIRRISRDMNEFAKRQDPLGPPEFAEGGPEKIAGRVKASVDNLGTILSGATSHGVTIRLFSGDHVPGADACYPWMESAGQYLVSIANAIEVEPIQLSTPSIADVAFRALATIQNQRALCPVLWHHGWVEGGAIVWSDSTGAWVDRTPGVDHLLSLVRISTAPHHGSDKWHHEPAWEALAPFLRATGTVVVCAGGQWNQGVATPYVGLPASRRACTRCRHGSAAQRPAYSGRSRTVSVVTDRRNARLVAGDQCPS